MDNPNSLAYSVAQAVDLLQVKSFLQPFTDARQILPRTDEELANILQHAFMAKSGERIVGFAAVEVYSRKLAELQCLAVDQEFRRLGIGRELVQRCVVRAERLGVLELMAISTSEELFMACGFDYSLPNQKRALFIQTQKPEDHS